ncbi:hypothetical protein BN2476_390048 [Paraburkholderia piptadeniae]|uniref:Uncharacterized protein n=1 Tax=Paraburkholderia piptadeniae TaxID=1701573 RepID=A0A1N7SAG3_9BURK|nr:hypothetical protein BN2476_390048 [Paraburkholderia piptadeniae]
MTHAACTALAGLPCRPSIVVTWRPSTADSGVMHERIGCPSRWTVHAPHCAMPQPNFVPCRPATSRIAHSSGMLGSASSVVDLPLRTKVVDINDSECGSGSDRSCALRGVSRRFAARGIRRENCGEALAAIARAFTATARGALATQWEPVECGSKRALSVIRKLWKSCLILRDRSSAGAMREAYIRRMARRFRHDPDDQESRR